MPLSFLRRLSVAAALLVALSSAALAAEPLVSPQWLAANKGSNVVVLDIRSAIDGSKPESFAQGHIPGAVHSDYDKAGWRVERSGVPFMVPTTAELEKLIGELGIDEDSHVVIVPAGVNVLDFGAAARTYWTLKYVGLKDVSILDGGLAAWKAAGLPIETGERKASPAIFTAKVDKSILIEAPQVEAAIEAKNAALVDARPASFFLGKEKAPASKAYGHIPGALNVDSANFYDPVSNRVKPKAELEAAVKDVPATGETIAYCNTGHWAATDWFVLHELLGRSEAKLYAGSMVDWTSKDNRPIDSSRTKWDDLKKALGIGS